MIANQKFGIEMPMKAAVVNVLSSLEYCRSDENTPTETPMINEKKVPTSPRIAEFTRAVRIWPNTDCWDTTEIPQLPRMKFFQYSTAVPCRARCNWRRS